MIPARPIQGRISVFRVLKDVFIGDKDSNTIYIEGMSPVEHNGNRQVHILTNMNILLSKIITRPQEEEEQFRVTGGR